MMRHLEPIDKGRQSAVCLERLHVKVGDQVDNSHSARHKLQATAYIIIITGTYVMLFLQVLVNNPMFNIQLQKYSG